MFTTNERMSLLFFSYFLRVTFYKDGPFIGGSWSVRVYEIGFAHPVSQFTGDLAKVISFPDAKKTASTSAHRRLQSSPPPPTSASMASFALLRVTRPTT